MCGSVEFEMVTRGMDIQPRRLFSKDLDSERSCRGLRCKPLQVKGGDKDDGGIIRFRNRASFRSVCHLQRRLLYRKTVLL